MNKSDLIVAWVFWFVEFIVDVLFVFVDCWRVQISWKFLFWKKNFRRHNEVINEDSKRKVACDILLLYFYDNKENGPSMDQRLSKGWTTTILFFYCQKLHCLKTIFCIFNRSSFHFLPYHRTNIMKTVSANWQLTLHWWKQRLKNLIWIKIEEMKINQSIVDDSITAYDYWCDEKNISGKIFPYLQYIDGQRFSFWNRSISVQEEFFPLMVTVSLKLRSRVVSIFSLLIKVEGVKVFFFCPKHDCTNIEENEIFYWIDC